MKPCRGSNHAGAAGGRFRRVRLIHYSGIVLAGLLTGASMASPELSAQTVALTNPVPILVVDPATNTGSVWLHLKNSGTEAGRVTVTPGTFVNNNTDRPLATQVTFFKGASTSGAALIDTLLAAGALLTVRMQVANLWEAGNTSGSVIINGTSHPVRASHGDFPFNVIVQAAGDRPQIKLSRSDAGVVTLKNEDQMTYPVAWSLALNDDTTVVQDSTTLGAKSITHIKVKPEGAWFTRAFDGLFKPEVRGGILTVKFAGQETGKRTSARQKTIEVDVALSPWSRSAMMFWGNLLVFLVLILGAVFSVFLSVWVPHRRARINLTSRLDEVAAKTRDISSDTESTLRVGVRVERERLKDALRALSPFTPGSEDSLKLIEKEIEALRKRVDVVDELDEMRRRLALLRVQTSKAPATILRRAGRSLNGASSLLNQRAPTDADLQTAQATIRTVAARLDVLEQEDAAFAGELAGRIKDLRLQYAVTRACPKYAAIEPKLKDLLGILDRSEFEDTANIKPGLYHLLDLATDKLFILQHYIIRFEDSAADRDRHRAVEDVEPRLFDCLRSVNAVGLIMADRLKSEIEENVYTDHIVEQLQARKVKIRYEPLTVYANAPVRLWIEFNDPRFNHAAALQEFRCIWDFGEIVGLEEGWEISHYFRNTEEANITVHFTGLDGNVITVKPDGPAPPTQPLTLTLKVPLLQRAGGRKDRLKLEAVQAVVALVIAVLALMGGALEQFLKLDVLPGLMAVFALGFSADRIKNLFSKT